MARLTARVGAEATRFSRIVDDLLDLSRIEAGATGSLSAVALSAVIDEAVEGFQEPAAARGIRLEVAPAGPALNVMANRRDLVSAVANLVDNAIKYSEPGRRGVRGRRSGEATARACGSGTKASASRDGTRSGSSSAFTVLTERGRAGLVGPGLVWLSSATWPRTTAATFLSILSKGRARLLRCGYLSPTKDIPVTEQVTVLLVEDEPSFVEALVVGLKREGFRVEVAYDGAEALDKFASVRPDLVLLDVMLPRVSGIDVCRTIRAAGSRTPIIMVTAKTSEIDTVVGLEVGADDYVSKPYRLRELVARMRAVLRRTPPPEEVPDDERRAGGRRPAPGPRAT